MTRYTVSPPMLVEKSDKSEPIKGHYYYGQPGEIYFDEGAYNNDTEAYEQHLSSLQQIRMSEELVKWCEENNKVEIDEGEFEVKDWCSICENTDYCADKAQSGICEFYQKLAFPTSLFAPVEVVDEWSEIFKEIWKYIDDNKTEFSNIDSAEKYLKENYRPPVKLTKL